MLYETFEVCRSETLKLFRRESTSITVKNSRECTLKFGDPDFQRDPCCDAVAALSLCCYPRNRNVSRYILKSTNDSRLSQCQSVSKIKAILGDAVAMPDLKTSILFT